MIERATIEDLIERIHTYRKQLPLLAESAIKGWNERPQRFCEFVESNLFYLLYRVPASQEDQFIQALVRTIKEIEDFASHLSLHGKLDEVEREQEKAIASAMVHVQELLSEVFSLS